MKTFLSAFALVALMFVAGCNCTKKCCVTNVDHKCKCPGCECANGKECTCTKAVCDKNGCKDSNCKK